jgi:GAF domain-containing protein
VSGGRTFISNAREEQQQYINGLLRENEKLRAANAVAEEQHRSAAGEVERLRARFEEVEHENQRFVEQYQYIEEQSSNLANLYVASYQLHTSVDRATVLNTIQEIVINLIGSEQLAIYQRDGEWFDLAASFGLNEERMMTTVAGEYAVERLGEGHIFPEVEDRQPLTACVPLKIDDEVIGAILVFRLLEHKPSLEAVDHELFELLAVHAATALHCATLNSRHAQVQG